MSPGVLDSRVPIYIRQKAKTEAIRVAGGVSEAVHVYTVMSGMKRLSYSIIEFIIHDG